MASKLCIIVCQNLLPEATTVVETEGFEGVELEVFPAHCGYPPLRTGEIEEIVSRCSADGHAVCLLGSCCLAGQYGIQESDGHRIYTMETCFELFANRELVKSYLRRGDHLLTPGWLAHWREYIATWDFDQTTARQFFGESVHRLVLLDTGTDPQSAAHLQELAEFVALPTEVVPVGLDLFRLFLGKIVLEWRLEQREKETKDELIRANRQATDYAATLDLMRILAGTATEEEVIDRVFDLFAMFCAPTHQLYLSFVDNEPAELYTWPDSTAAEQQRHPPQDWAGDYAWTESGAGFCLRITRHDQVLGILEVEGIRFPQYREYYLNLALNLVDVCALSIANARSYQERQRVTEALRESEMTARALLDAPLDLAMLLDEQGRILDANATFAAQVGQEKAALIGRFAREFFPPEVSARRKQLEEQVLQTGQPVRIEEERNGSWYDSVIYPIHDTHGRVSKVAVLARDITESKQAQELLRIKDRAIESSINAIAMSNLEGLLTYVNPSFLKMWGYENTDEILGQPAVSFWESQQDAVQVVEALSDSSGWIGEMMAMRKDRTMFPVQLSAHLVTNAAGETTGMMAYFVDITERRQAEERMEHYATELERRNEEIKQFAYIVSHDMRSPLVNLKGFAAELDNAVHMLDQIMETTRPHLDPAQQQVLETTLHEDIPEALDFIDASVLRMDRFTQAVLNLSRLGRRDLLLEPVDMAVLVRGVLQSLAHQVEAGQAEVTVGPLPKVTADRLSMEQVMGNLLTNAVLYLDPQRPGKIEVAAEESTDQIIFLVQDNGVGIAEKDREKVFAPFRRAGSPDVPGEGMGLAYVELLVRRHGGQIWFESEPGVGTTFFFTLPHQGPQGVDYAGS